MSPPRSRQRDSVPVLTWSSRGSGSKQGFALFTGEETGLLGSRGYVASHRDEMDRHVAAGRGVSAPRWWGAWSPSPARRASDGR